MDPCGSDDEKVGADLPSVVDLPGSSPRCRVWACAPRPVASARRGGRRVTRAARTERLGRVAGATRCATGGPTWGQAVRNNGLVRSARKVTWPGWGNRRHRSGWACGVVCTALFVGVAASPAVAGDRALAGKAPGTLYPIPARPALPSPCPPPPLPPGPPGKPLPPPAVAEAAIPLTAAPPARHVNLSAVSGKGIWVTLFPSEAVNVGALVATARASGLHQLWVRTGSTHDGYYGGPLLAALVPRAHAAGIAVIAWDFPTLTNPAADALRARDAVRSGADGFSPDIETAAEGTYLTARRVAYYLATVRADVGSTPVVATVPRPLAGHVSTYPYAAEAPFVDVFAPMVYWSCTEPGVALTAAMTPLERLRPVAPIGQDYDMASEGGRHGLPTAQEIWRFLDVARLHGAIGASLYDLEAGGPAALLALQRYPWTSGAAQ